MSSCQVLVIQENRRNEMMTDFWCCQNNFIVSYELLLCTWDLWRILYYVEWELKTGKLWEMWTINNWNSLIRVKGALFRGFEGCGGSENLHFMSIDWSDYVDMDFIHSFIPTSHVRTLTHVRNRVAIFLARQKLSFTSENCFYSFATSTIFDILCSMGKSLSLVSHVSCWRRKKGKLVRMLTTFSFSISF